MSNEPKVGIASFVSSQISVVCIAALAVSVVVAAKSMPGGIYSSRKFLLYLGILFIIGIAGSFTGITLGIIGVRRKTQSLILARTGMFLSIALLALQAGLLCFGIYISLHR